MTATGRTCILTTFCRTDQCLALDTLSCDVSHVRSTSFVQVRGTISYHNKSSHETRSCCCTLTPIYEWVPTRLQQYCYTAALLLCDTGNDICPGAYDVYLYSIWCTNACLSRQVYGTSDKAVAAASWFSSRRLSDRCKRTKLVAFAGTWQHPTRLLPAVLALPLPSAIHRKLIRHPSSAVPPPAMT